MTVQGLTTKIQIWDTAGQEQFKRLAPMYYKNAAAAIICYDVTSPQSFNEVQYWVDELAKNHPVKGLVLAICATKCDLSTASVDTRQAELLSREIGAIFLRTSAKDNVHVNALFEMVATRVLSLRDHEGAVEAPVALDSPTPFETQDRIGLSGRQQGSPERSIVGDPRDNSMLMDEKKNEEEDEVKNMESHDTTDSKCNATQFLCGDAEEMMGGATRQSCVIQ